mgnify:FL=1
MTTLATYNSLDSITQLGKEEITALAEKQIQEILDAGSAEQAYAFLHKVGLMIDTVKNGIKDSAITEIERGNNHAFGVKLIKMSKTTNDYSTDPTHVALKQQLASHETFLKSLKAATTLLNENTGELTTYSPPIKKISDYIKTEF